MIKGYEIKDLDINIFKENKNFISIKELKEALESFRYFLNDRIDNQKDLHSEYLANIRKMPFSKYGNYTLHSTLHKNIINLDIKRGDIKNRNVIDILLTIGNYNTIFTSLKNIKEEFKEIVKWIDDIINAIAKPQEINDAITFTKNFKSVPQSVNSTDDFLWDINLFNSFSPGFGYNLIEYYNDYLSSRNTKENKNLFYVSLNPFAQDDFDLVAKEEFREIGFCSHNVIYSITPIDNDEEMQ